MKASKALSGFLDEARGGDAYWVEAAKLQFAVALEARRCAAGLTYKAVADKLGTSAAYVTKVFRGDTNMTLETMVKLARATGGELEIRIIDAASTSASAKLPGKADPIATAPTPAELDPNGKHAAKARA